MQYNGNISSVLMKSASIGSTTPAQLGYDFRYDRLNRITSGVSSTAGTKNGYYNENVVYDNEGNITSLGRYDQTSPGVRTNIDSLTYLYYGSNQQAAINDQSTYTGAGGFTDRVKLTGGEYLYDMNGNMKQDLNKGISPISYNLLNLPGVITFSNGNTVLYVYSASGEKLRKIFTVGSNITTTEYIDGIEYDNGVLAFEQTEEGRARYNGAGAYVYEYDLKDHLGDTRLTFTTANNTINVVQENSYYPFGATIASLYPVAPSPENHYLYNHKELQEETNLYDYGARFYDPVIGRWTSVDPHSEKYFNWSPFVYTYNNAIKNIDPDGLDGIRIIDNSNKTITIRADYYVQSQARVYYDGNKQTSSKGYSAKEISSMQTDYNKYLNEMNSTVSDGEYKGYAIKYDLQFKAGGAPDEAEQSAASDKQDGYSIGNSFENANSVAYPKFAPKEITNDDETISTTTVGGQTADHKDIIMNTTEDTKMNRIHEIFHTLGFDHPKGTGGSQGIMKYPPSKPTQIDINQLGNGSFLPAVVKKKPDDKK